ncbi:hypothetical protein CLLI_12200 [Clostridium liquoris]|jgi:hypothetical protein|uniref:DUF7852 domain-containing protein n=2 Tax=Clostridium liquoris TaxID=1289519 RepID=A0A2T0B4Q7_9CLOT|nr:hypothetical protein CLLI_12200 [Clostridium liquoris]
MFLILLSVDKKEDNFMNNNDFEDSACCISPEHNICSSVTTSNEPLTEQICVPPAVISAGPVFVKIPVVLAESNITIPVHATITLDQPAIEIKRIRKNVFLTEARLVPFSQDNRPGTGIVFIEGFVRKNIEFATQTCQNGVNICGDIRQCTVQVPFSVTTRVRFFRQPVFTENTTPSEMEFFTDKLKSCDICADNVIGRNPCDQSFFVTEFFNEKPFVELVKADIAELDIHKNPTSTCHNPTEQTFTQITEKLAINLTFKVLQNQQVELTAIAATNPCTA